MDTHPPLPPALSRMLSMDPKTLWGEKVEAAEYIPSFGRHAGLAQHVEMLPEEFSGKPVAFLYHACLIVLIRRELQLEDSLAKYFALWDENRERLTQGLDSRWLCSAMDTFADYGRDPAKTATAVAAILFVNTIKLYETERRVTGQHDNPVPYSNIQGRQPLHDGLTAFVVGHGDMVQNLLRRARRLDSGITGSILQELLDRACTHDTVIKRFRSVHKREHTAW